MFSKKTIKTKLWFNLKSRVDFISKRINNLNFYFLKEKSRAKIARLFNFKFERSLFPYIIFRCIIHKNSAIQFH
jgi:hypothetical protein